MVNINNKFIILFLILTAFILLPEPALAGGISDFAGPLEKVGQTITGPVGKWVSIIAMALCGTVFIFQREDLTGGMKLLLSVAFGISFISFAVSIVEGMFSFSGALIA